MRTQIINTAAVLFSVFMLSSCDKESLVPISDVTESSTYFKDKVGYDDRASDYVQTYYTDPESEKKTMVEARSKAYYGNEYARQGDENHVKLEDPEAIAKTSDNTRLNVESDDNALQSDAVVFKLDDPEAIARTFGDSRLTKKRDQINALNSDRAQTVASKKDGAAISFEKNNEVSPNTIKTNARTK